MSFPDLQSFLRLLDERGELLRVLRPWIAGRLTLYAALPSRQFMPERSRVFLDYLMEQTRLKVTGAMAACNAC